MSLSVYLSPCLFVSSGLSVYSFGVQANEWVSSVSEIRPTPAPERSSPRPMSAIPANHSVTSQPVQVVLSIIFAENRGSRPVSTAYIPTSASKTPKDLSASVDQVISGTFVTRRVL